MECFYVACHNGPPKQELFLTQSWFAFSQVAFRALRLLKRPSRTTSAPFIPLRLLAYKCVQRYWEHVLKWGGCCCSTETGKAQDPSTCSPPGQHQLSLRSKLRGCPQSASNESPFGDTLPLLINFGVNAIHPSLFSPLRNVFFILL